MQSDQTEPDLEAAYAVDGPEENRALYKSWAETYDSDFADASGYRLPSLVAQAYLKAGGTGPALDVGCGTGLVAECLPPDMVVDGLDLSPDMLTQSREKGRYRDLFEADLLKPLPLDPGRYAGVLSAGTFTHGHVGPEALHGIIALLASDGNAALIVNAAFYEKAGFEPILENLVQEGAITKPTITEERIYEPRADTPHEAHADDTALILVFRKI